MEASQLQRVLDAHHLACGAIIVANGELVARVGDFTSFGNVDLVSALLGPYGSSQETFASVQDSESPPRMWTQGDAFALAMRVRDKVAVVFGEKRGGTRSQYELSKAVGQCIADEVNRLGGSA
jgi:hypothetical protein